MTEPRDIRRAPKATGDLLDPKNDYVFKRLFVRRPQLLVALINAVRPDAPPGTLGTGHPLSGLGTGHPLSAFCFVARS